MSVCIEEVSQWMQSNRLQLNTTKTDIHRFATSRRQHQIPQTPTRYVMTSRSVRDLGVYLDADASMTTHITKLLCSLAPDPCYTAISHKTCLAVADRLFGPVTTGLWQRHVSRFTKLHVRQAAVRLERCCTSTWRFESVTPLLRDLRWLRVPQRVKYKLSVLVYRCLHNLAPEYLCDELQRAADISSRQRLRSSSTFALIVPSTRLSTVGDRAFPAAASRIWNSLQLHVTSAPSPQTFREEEAEALFVQPQFPILICCFL